MATKIEWCDETLNFITGCIHRCSYCYARRMAYRLSYVDGTKYRRLILGDQADFSPAVHLDVYRKAMDALGRKRSSRRIFISSMGDPCCATMYHRTDVRRENPHMEVVTRVEPEAMKTKEVLQLIRRMCRRHERHTFLVLTKNPIYYAQPDFQEIWPKPWPVNAHLGVSVDSMGKECSRRLGWLAQAPAKTTWVSVEPLLDETFDPRCFQQASWKPKWVVVGGLSGQAQVPRGCLSAALRIRNWCQVHRVPLFVKDNLRAQFTGELWPQQYP